MASLSVLLLRAPVSEGTSIEALSFQFESFTQASLVPLPVAVTELEWLVAIDECLGVISVMLEGST